MRQGEKSVNLEWQEKQKVTAARGFLHAGVTRTEECPCQGNKKSLLVTGNSEK